MIRPDERNACGRCFKGVDPTLKSYPKLITINEEANHEIVHRGRFRKHPLEGSFYEGLFVKLLSPPLIFYSTDTFSHTSTLSLHTLRASTEEVTSERPSPGSRGASFQVLSA